MLHFVELTDISRLMNCKEESKDYLRTRAQKEAVGIMLELVNRLPHPRAYVLDPTYRPAHDLETEAWRFGMDLLSVYLNVRNISIIDPDTLRFLVVHCPALHQHLDAPDPLWLTLVASGVIDQVYIPREQVVNKRHTLARERATSQRIEIYDWHWNASSRPSHP